MILTFKNNCGGSNALSAETNGCWVSPVCKPWRDGTRASVAGVWVLCVGACLPPLPSEALRVRPAQSCRTGGGCAAKARSSGHSPRRDGEESQLLGTCFPSGQSCGFVGPVGCGGPAGEVTRSQALCPITHSADTPLRACLLRTRPRHPRCKHSCDVREPLL